MNKCIVQFESEDFYRAVVEQLLYTVDMQISSVAKTKKDAEKLIGQIINQEIVPDLAIIDTILEHSHTEGEVIAKKLREISPKTKIIAYTIIPDVEWADYLALKSGKDAGRTVVKGISELLKIEFPTSNDAHKYNSD